MFEIEGNGGAHVGSNGQVNVLIRGFSIAGVTVQPQVCSIGGPSGEIRVEPRAMDVLVVLANHAGSTVSRDELIAAVWKHPHVTDEALSRCISILRHALGDDSAQPRFIETIPKRGYRLKSSVVFDAAANPVRHPASLAVMPFLNLSGDPGEDHVADGLTELLISNIASLARSVRVISRTSSMHYKGSRARLTQIAQELDVELIVEGSVLRSGRQLQVVVQVIDPATDGHVFTRTYTRELADLLPLQNEIAWTIAGEIGLTLEPSDRARLPKARPLCDDAMHTYLRARYFWAQRTPEGLQKALREYEACIRLEPMFASAYAGIAYTLIVLAFYGVESAVSLRDRAREHAERAYALDPDSAESLTAMGVYRYFFEWRRDAETFLRDALRANPNFDIARLALGDMLLFRREYDAALRELYVAARLNPFDLGLQMNLGEFMLYARRYEEALDQFRKTVDIGPHFWPARCKLAETHAILGQAEAAKKQLERASEDIPVAGLHQPRSFVHAMLGERDEALALLAELEAARAQRYVSPWEIARGYAALGEADMAFRWIDIGIDERAPTMLLLDIYTGFDPIRDDPRFVGCLRRIGLA